jgi:hypothetical protein
VFRAILLTLALFWLATGSAAERLVLYFDINKTLVISDQPGEMNGEAVNDLLSAKYSGIWGEGQGELMTYLSYVKEFVLPREGLSPAEYRRYTFYFVCWLYSSGHPLACVVQQEYCCVMRRLSMMKGSVFPSFYRVVKLLSQAGIQFSIVLRSYGPNLDSVSKEIECKLGESFFAGRGSFDSGVLALDGIGQLDLEQSYLHLTSGENWVIQDDWAWWKDHGEARAYGKPLYTKTDEEILQIFFDDRLQGGESPTDIVVPIDVQTGRVYSSAELTRRGQLVRVDTLDAILNENYFVDKVIEALLKKQCRDSFDTSLKGVDGGEGLRQADQICAKDQSPLHCTVRRPLLPLQ